MVCPVADCFGTLFARQTAARLDVDGEIDLHITSCLAEKELAVAVCLFGIMRRSRFTGDTKMTIARLLGDTAGCIW